jgi:hypothetical protein
MRDASIMRPGIRKDGFVKNRTKVIAFEVQDKPVLMITREPLPLVTTLSFLGGLLSILNLTWLIRWINTKFFERSLRNLLR